MEYSKEDLMEAKKQILGVGENMGTEESKKIWEENAQFWDNAMGDESNEFHREVVRPKVTELLSPNPADYILDIACGNGNYSSYLAQRGASVVAFDYSKKMIELAKRRQSQYAKQIEFCVADATDRKSILELKRNRAFTKAVSNMAIMDITDIEPLLMAVYELLQESGIFVFATQHPCFVTLTEKYMTPHSYYDIAIEGQPKEQIYYLLNEQTYLHLRENLAGVGYEVFDKNSPLPVEEGQIPREVLGNTQRRIETARAYYLTEHQDEPVGKIQNVAVTTLEKFRSGVRKRRNLAPRSLPDNDVRFIDPMYNELFRVPDGGVVQMTYPDGHQRSEVVEYLGDYHIKIGSTVQHICEFAERMARSRAIVEPEPLTQQEQRAWNLEYDYYLTVQAEDGAWEYALYQGDCCLLERGKIDAPELMIEEVRDEILYSHNLRNKDCIPLCQEEFAQKLTDRNEIQSYRMKQFQQSGHDCYLVMQLQQDADPALRFAAMRYLNKQNIASSIENYEILYRGNLPEGKRSVPQAELLEQLYQKFNCARPLDYHGLSLSVSDVIMLNQDGKISAHYVDSIGFKELPGFLDKKPERTSVLQTLKEKCDVPECNPAVCRKARDAHEL